MMVGVDLLSFCWKLATLFDTVSTNKAFHIWVVMFTYLGLVSAWLYYRRHAHDDEKTEAHVGSKSEGLADRCEEDKFEQSDLEDDLIDVIQIENDDISSDDCFEQAARFEQETQTDRISAVVRASTLQTKEAEGKFYSNESFDPVEIAKNNDVNNDRYVASSPESEESHRQEKSPFGISQEKDGSLVEEISQLKNNNSTTQSERSYGSSRISKSNDSECWSTYEKELEIGFLSPDTSSDYDEFNYFENEEITEKWTSHITGSAFKRELVEPAQKKDSNENPMKYHPDITELSPVYETERESWDDISLSTNIGENFDRCNKAGKEEDSCCSSNHTGKSDVEKSTKQTTSLNQSNSECDAVKNYDRSDSPNVLDVTGYVSNVVVMTEGCVSSHRVPSGEFLHPNDPGSGSLIETHLQSSENMNPSFNNLKPYNSEEKNGRHFEFEHKDSSPNGVDNEQSDNKIAPASAANSKYFSYVNESICKHIANEAEIQRLNTLPDEAVNTSNINENEAEQPSDGRYEMKDKCNERYEGVTDDIDGKIECVDIVSDLQSEVPGSCSEICDNGSEINDPVNLQNDQFKTNSCLSEITDRFNDLSSNSLNVGDGFKELPVTTHPITYLYSERLDKNNEPNNELLLDNRNEAIENEAIVSDYQSSGNLYEMANIHGELEEKVSNSPTESLIEAPEEIMLKGPFGEGFEDIYKNDEYPLEEELNRDCRDDEECKFKDKIEESSVEENQDKKVSFATDFSGAEIISSIDNCLYTCEGDESFQEENCEVATENSHTEREDMKCADNINKYLEVDVKNTGIALATDVVSDKYVVKNEEDFPHRNSSESGFAIINENGAGNKNVLSNDGFTCQSDEISVKRTDDTRLEFRDELQNLSSAFDRDLSVDYGFSVDDIEETMSETFIEGEQSMEQFDKEHSVTYVENGEYDFSEEATFDFYQEFGDMKRPYNIETDSESGESTESTEEIDYERLVSSGSESLEESDDNRFSEWINENENEGIYYCTNDSMDAKANINVLDTIDEVEEIGLDNEVCAESSAAVKEEFFHDVILQRNEGLGLSTCLQKDSNSEIQLNRRETALALMCYPKNAGFLRYFANLLLSPGVFVDVFNNVPFRLVCTTNNADRITELITKELSARSHFGLSVANRDLHFAKDICEIARDIDYYFSSFKEDCKRRQRRAILPGHFGISFENKAHYCEAEKLTPIVCDSNPTLDVDTVHVEGDNTLSCEVVLPATIFEGCNEFDSSQIFKTKPTQTLVCKGDVNDHDRLTTLAAVHNGSFNDYGSRWTGISNYLKGEVTTFLGIDDLVTKSEYAEFQTDGTSTQRQLKRQSATEFDEDAEKKRRCSLWKNNKPVSQHTFDIPFEQGYKFSGSENLQTSYESNEVIGDSEPTADEVASKELNFDLLFSKPQPFADLKSDETFAPSCENTSFHEEKPREFETGDKAIDKGANLDMGQIQSFVFTKGTLAMPVSNNSLRGISVRNQGEYAVINYKNTRFAPLISVDRRIEITMPVPKQSEILPEKKAHRIPFETKKSNDLPSEKDLDTKANKSINVEVFSEFLKHSIVGSECVKKSEDSSIGRKHNLSSVSYNHKTMETMPLYENPTAFSNRCDKIAEIAQNFSKPINDECLEGISGGREILNSDHGEPLVAAEEQRDMNAGICSMYSNSEDKVAVNDSCFKHIVESEPESYTTEGKYLYYERESTANDSYFEAPIVTVESSTIKDDDTKNDPITAVSAGCFGDFGVTNPNTENDQIQCVNNNDFQDAVNSHEELSVTDNQHEYSLLQADKIYGRKQKELPQKVGVDSFQTKLENDSVEVRKDNENFIENVGTIDLIARPKNNRVRSKSLTSLPEGLFENMSWFYRDRPSSVCFDNNTVKASSYGSLRRTKSAEISRRKPKIRMSTNFERRPIKETNLDELIKSLEYLGPRKGENVHGTQKEITNATSSFGKEISATGIVRMRKAENKTMLPSPSKHGEGKEREAVSKLVEKFENPSKSTRKIVVETKHLFKYEPPQQRNTMSASTGKNVKHLNEANKIVGSLDKNNNNNIRLDQRNKTFSDGSADKLASFGVDELRKQSFRTNEKENLTKDCSLEQHPDTKRELHAALNANREDKQNQLGSIQCSSEDKPLKICNEQRNAITSTKRQLTGNVTEDKADLAHDCNEKAIPFTDVNIADKKTSEFASLVNEEKAQRTSIYGFSVFLSESQHSDLTDFELKPEIDTGVLQSPQQEHLWLQQRSFRDVDGNSNEKVSDIDLILKTTFQSSVENLEELNDNTSKASCSSCNKVIENTLNSVAVRCDECKEKDNLQQFKRNDKPRSGSFRKDKRLRKWLEDRQNSMNSDDKVILDSMNADDQSRLLKKIALSKGIDYKRDDEEEIKKKRHFSLRSRQFDFLEQLRYLINFEDDDYDEHIKNLEVNEKEHDAIELLREYETNRQLKKGKSPLVSEDEGNDSDAFTDITDTTFSDYTRSRHSLNSLLLSQGSLNRSGSLDVLENDHVNDSKSKEISWKSADFVDASVSNSTPQKEAYFGRNVPLDRERINEKNEVIETNVEEDFCVLSIPTLSYQPDTTEREKSVATELFSTDDVNGLISQGNSAVRNRRGRASKLNAPRTGINTRTEPGIGQLTQPGNMNFDNVFIDNTETNLIETNIVDNQRPLTETSIRRYNLTESCIYADSPCSLLTERLNDASYENLRVKLVNKPNTLLTVPSTHIRKEAKSRSPYQPSRVGSLPSPIIRTLNDSPQQKRRATSLREVSMGHKTHSLQSRSFHSVPTSPPRFLRELSSQKSNGSYTQHKKECRSLPDLIANPDGALASPVKSPCSSGGSSTLSLQQRSPRLRQVSSTRYATQFPIRSPVRSPRLSEFEDEFADTETVFSDHTAFFSDSSIDFRYGVDDEDFFLPNSMLDGNFSPNFDDFLSLESDGTSSGEYFVPLNTRSKRPESRVISCAFGPCKNKDFVHWSQRSQFTSCVSCFTYYCSKECRKAHWNEHKLTCLYGRISYYAKALVRRFETKWDVNEKLSRLALEGFRESGRGCVLISFSSPMAAKFFLTSGTNSFVNDPSYATLNEVLNDGIITKHQVLLQQTLLDYNPEIEFVVNLTVYVGKQNELQASPRSRFNSSAVLRCSKIPLNSIFLSSELEPYPETSYDIRVFYLPKSKSHHFINEAEARRYYCREVSYGLRKYGVVLKRDYPEAYDKLCLYVEHNVEFLPITLYGQSNGKNYKCIVFPEEFSGSNGTLELQGRGMLV